MTNALTAGIHHVGLSVADIDEARRFFCQVLGFREAGAVPEYPAVFVSDGTTLITLWQVADPQTANGFDRRGNIGLHHLALRVVSVQCEPISTWHTDRLSAWVFRQRDFATLPTQQSGEL